jgi:hypothetical protein
VAAALGAGVLAVGAGAAHLGGVFRSTGDDAARAVRNVDDLSPPTPPRKPLVPPPPATPTDDLVREGNDDVTAKEVICFAWDNYDVDETTGEFLLPTEADFVESVAEAFVPSGTPLSYRLKADSLYETINDPETEAADVATELAC